MKNSIETVIKDEIKPISRTVVNAAISAALDAANSITVESTSLVSYQTNNHVLVIGDDQRVNEVVTRLESSMTLIVLIKHKKSDIDLKLIPASVSIAYGELSSLSGNLGNFNAELMINGKITSLAQVYYPKIKGFDQVIDLGKTPMFNNSLLPFGYFSPQDKTELEEILTTIPEMLGEFEKPKFFEYNVDICAHGNSGIKACQRCINACPAGAITSIKDAIEVNPFLCQGGGTCATVCPSGAIQYVYPRLQDTLEKIRAMLKAYYEAGGENAAIAFYAAEESSLFEHAALEHYIPFQLEEIASVGMDVWLSAFAYGAREVVLLTHENTLPEINQTLDTQLTYAHAIMAGMGYEISCLHKLLVKSDAVHSTPDSINQSFNVVIPGKFIALNDKRSAIRMAVDHLYLYAPVAQEITPLPPGAPFGEVQVNKENCTLCMACVSVCPAKALADGGELPQLRFSEANCVQCGLCSSACPETALTLSARYNFDPALKREQRLLHEDEPFCCTQCAKPFATHSVINNIIGKLANHSMFQSDEAVNRLRMCEDCRVRDMFSEEMDA
jgi:ferredoxin